VKPGGVELSPDGGNSVVVVMANGLRKTYRELVAVDDVSFSVTEREIFGILGPNGAGKTTTVESVIGLRVPDAGRVRVLGLDPRHDLDALHTLSVCSCRASALPGQLKAGEILDLFHPSTATTPTWPRSSTLWAWPTT
jgi:ABC-2 type transport system ATP-binding protein